MPKYHVGQKCIIWGSSASVSHYNGEIVTLREFYSQGTRCSVNCRVLGSDRPFYADYDCWSFEEILVVEQDTPDSELILAEKSLRPYDPPSEQTSGDLMESLKKGEVFCG